jgi:methyl-accepting chemotaxis protein
MERNKQGNSNMPFVKKNSGTNSVSINNQNNINKRQSRTLVKQQQISESIAIISKQILDNTQDSVNATEQLKDSMEQIATAAEQNSGASEQALANVKDITKNIHDMEQSIKNVIVSTLATGETITGSVDKINQTVERMNQAVSVAKSSSEKSEELKNSSQNIGEAVGFIAKIADQTNLLALNAAIEASRAKEHGKGFAVVADETRSLAGESEKNAQFISELVNGIQVSIDNIITNILTTRNIIDDTGHVGLKLSEKLEELMKIATYSVEAARNITNFTTKLSNLSSDVRSGSQGIAESSSNIALEVEKTLDGVETQLNALTQIEDDVKELSRSAEDLKYSNDTIKSAEEIASLADTISASMDDIHQVLENVTVGLNKIESSSHSTNQNALSNKEKIEQALEVSRDVDALINIARKNFDILKVSFSDIKSTMLSIKEDFIRSVKEGDKARLELNVIMKETRNVQKTVGNISNSIIQLNMLAISGSIEAARAGEFGKGFGVVSSDIRNLAKDSETNTEKINDIIESMNSEINTVQNNWRNLLNSQNNEQTNIDLVIQDVDKITELLIDLLDRFQSLKSINDANVDGLNQVLNGISEIQKAIELSASNAMESRKASEVIIHTIAHIGERVEELAIMADEIQQ